MSTILRLSLFLLITKCQATTSININCINKTELRGGFNMYYDLEFDHSEFIASSLDVNFLLDGYTECLTDPFGELVGFIITL